MRRNKATIMLITFCVVSLTFLLFNVFKYYTRTQPVFGGPIYKGAKDSEGIALVCNVDWGGEYLPDMLKVLHALNIEAAFFVTGKWAEGNKDLLELVMNSGHIIGNHGYSHLDHSKLSYDQNLTEIKKAQDVIEDIIGKKPKYFAPPSGAYNKNTIKAAEDLGYKVILWSIDTIDWRRDGVDNIINRVNKKIHGGGIVLMHPTAQTLEALETIVNNIRGRGFEILSLEHIVNTIEKSKE